MEASIGSAGANSRRVEVAASAVEMVHPATVQHHAVADTPRTGDGCQAMPLAGEAGLRRGEVSRVHTPDLLEGSGGAELAVHGKGGK